MSPATPDPDTKLGRMLVLLRAGTELSEACRIVGASRNYGSNMRSQLRKQGLLEAPPLKKTAAVAPTPKAETPPRDDAVVLGVSLKTVPESALRRLRWEAQRRGTSLSELVKRVLVNMDASDLYDAVLEE